MVLPYGVDQLTLEDEFTDVDPEQVGELPKQVA
jgi:hypothetical protein